MTIVQLSPDASEALIGYHLHKDICTIFDGVDVADFKTLAKAKYLDAYYCQARNYKTTIGSL